MSKESPKGLRARITGMPRIVKILLILVLLVGVVFGGMKGYGMFGGDDEITVAEPITASAVTAEAPDIPMTLVGTLKVGDLGPECYTANKVARLEMPWDAVIIRSGDAWSENNTGAIMVRGIEDGRLMDVRVVGIHRPGYANANQVYYDNADRLAGKTVTIYPIETVLKPQEHDQQSAKVTMANGTDLAEFLIDNKIAVKS